MVPTTDPWLILVITVEALVMKHPVEEPLVPLLVICRFYGFLILIFFLFLCFNVFLDTTIQKFN
jgi:hypothetical protein